MASVTMMADSGLPCFGYKEPLKSLEARFHMEMTDVEAARFMRETVDDAYDKVGGVSVFVEVFTKMCHTHLFLHTVDNWVL